MNMPLQPLPIEVLDSYPVIDESAVDALLAQEIAKDPHKIVVLDDGKITGVGTHEELLKNNEEYREICSSQTDGKEA